MKAPFKKTKTRRLHVKDLAICCQGHLSLNFQEITNSSSDILLVQNYYRHWMGSDSEEE